MVDKPSVQLLLVRGQVIELPGPAREQRPPPTESVFSQLALHIERRTLDADPVTGIKIGRKVELHCLS